MDTRLELKGIDTNDELIISDCPEFDFIEIGIGFAPWNLRSVKLDIDAIDKLESALRRIKFEKTFLKK